MTKTPNIAILILAAGASNRMGIPKQLLPWKHTTLLEHTIETVLELNIEHTFVVLGANIKLMSSKIKSYPIEIIHNINWQNGLGSSIASGAKYIRSLKKTFDGILIVLADQPFIDVTHLNTLIESFLNKKHKIITTSYNKYKEGVPAIFDAVYFKELSNLNNDFGAKELIENEKTNSVMISEDKLTDIDTKDDYNRLI
ncbi:nucleotidyltransferase family protein [Flavobacteriaceae bacterium AU392]|nr:nucleotidyltransferase family protein [Flavobacteriaceae bacterium]RKM84192.1 nucleotidyltransferase family protein [Flavobacteriaceae bacterium AU392]